MALVFFRGISGKHCVMCIIYMNIYASIVGNGFSKTTRKQLQMYHNNSVKMYCIFEVQILKISYFYYINRTVTYVILLLSFVLYLFLSCRSKGGIRSGLNYAPAQHRAEKYSYFQYNKIDLAD